MVKRFWHVCFYYNTFIIDSLFINQSLINFLYHKDSSIGILYSISIKYACILVHMSILKLLGVFSAIDSMNLFLNLRDNYIKIFNIIGKLYVYIIYFYLI